MTPSPVVFSASGADGEDKGSKPVHAALELFEPAKDGSLSKPGPSLGKIDFQFNPKDLTLAKSATWSRGTSTRSKKSSPPQYTGPQPSKLTLEMFFDASDTQSDSVVKSVEKLFACCVPTQASHDQKKDSPPWVIFKWGGLTGFLAYISSVQAKYTLFTPTGLPIRATCTVTLDELAGEAPKQNPTSGGRVPHREHVVLEGESLATIAYREYGDPGLWRRVAEANRIDDPFRVRAGHRVLLPTVTELLRTSAPIGGGATSPVVPREVTRAAR
jgi:hypothetical protein